MKRGQMDDHNIAIVGLGRIGTAFLREILAAKEGYCLKLVCVVEKQETEGKQLAREKGIRIATLDELIELNVGVDVIFDLTGNATFGEELRARLAKMKNNYTNVAPLNITRLIWALVSDEYLPAVHGTRYQAIADTLLEQARAGIIK